jgi:hypothetical protein
MMSSKGIIFATGEGLIPGMNAQIAIAWPYLLDGHIRLQLMLEAIITASEDGLAAARILAYHFRTRRPASQEKTMGPQVGEKMNRLRASLETDKY